MLQSFIIIMSNLVTMWRVSCHHKPHKASKSNIMIKVWLGKRLRSVSSNLTSIYTHILFKMLFANVCVNF